MNGQNLPDRFEVLNGPEDGTEFPLTRSPLDIGANPACAVHLRLDPQIRSFHARVTAVADGYRIRRLTGAPVYVNGKRAGLIRSRTVRSGGIVHAGATQLALECAPDGLAGRTHGLSSESDLGWALRLLFRYLFLGMRALWRFLRDLLGRFFWIILLLAAGWLALSYFRPRFLPAAWSWLWYACEWLLYQCSLWWDYAFA